MIKRIGFACKWIDSPDQVNGIKPKDDCKKYNTGTTTITWLNKQARSVAEEKLWDLMCQNIESTRMLVERVGQLDPHLRMVRLSSDILPAYTEPNWSYFWRRPDVVAYAERHFARIGELARANNVSGSTFSLRPVLFVFTQKNRTRRSYLLFLVTRYNYPVGFAV